MYTNPCMHTPNLHINKKKYPYFIHISFKIKKPNTKVHITLIKILFATNVYEDLNPSKLFN